MDEAMVTARMDAAKKRHRALVLARKGFNASQVVNLMYDKLLAQGDATFLRAAEHNRPCDAVRRTGRGPYPIRGMAFFSSICCL